VVFENLPIVQLWGGEKKKNKCNVPDQTREKRKFQVFGNKLVRKIVGCKYEMSKQFCTLQYEEDCVAWYYESEIYESTNGWTCAQGREGARNAEKWIHGKHKI
jgi:hypothetical protein